MKKKRKYPEIKPLFIKNEDGKTTSVFLEKKVFKSILEELKEFEKIKKKIK